MKHSFINKIIVKDQKINISDIASGRNLYIPETGFETSVFDFIQKWFQPNAEFEVSTSGSTGLPKRISVPKELMVQSSEKTAKALDLHKGMTTLLAMDPKYIGGMMMIARSLHLEMDIWVVEPSSNPLFSLPSDFNLDFAAFVPMQISKILEETGQESLNRIKTVLIGGGPVSKAMNEKILSLKNSVYHTYGMTETLSHIALKKLNGNDKTGWYKTLPGIKIDLDNRGCLKITGPFPQKEIITNDLVEITGPDTFDWIGRYDNVINSGGIKLHPEQIEPQIADAMEEINLGGLRFFLGGIPDDMLGQRMILFVEGDLNDKDKDLLDHLKSVLDVYQCPKRIIEIPKFSITDTGKIKREEIIRDYFNDI